MDFFLFYVLSNLLILWCETLFPRTYKLNLSGQGRQKPATGLLGRRHYDEHARGGGVGEKKKQSGSRTVERSGTQEVVAVRNRLL